MSSEIKQKSGAGSTIKQFIVLASLAAMIVVFIFLSIKNFITEHSVKNFQKEDIILGEVWRRTVLPVGSPQIRRIEEPELLRELNPDVYGDVQQNDVVLEYTTKVYIYRPSEERVIQIVER